MTTRSAKKKNKQKTTIETVAFLSLFGERKKRYGKKKSIKKSWKKNKEKAKQHAEVVVLYCVLLSMRF